jgi:hypothetical protein
MIDLPTWLESMIGDDEIVRWVGHPGIGRRHGLYDWGYLVLGVILITFGLVALLGGVDELSIPVTILGIVCLVLGWFAAVAPMSAARKAAALTWYVITGRRVIIARPKAEPIVYDAPLRHLRITQNGDTLTVGLNVQAPLAAVHRKTAADWMLDRSHPPALLLVPDSDVLRSALSDLEG